MSYDIFQTLQDKVQELEKSVKALRKTGNEYAMANHTYKVAVSKTALMLKESGMPVTLIDKVIYGHESVAELRLKRDIAEVLYKANQEHINATKLQIRLLEAQIQREWTTPTSS